MGELAESNPLSMERVLTMVREENGTYVYKNHKTLHYRLNQFKAGFKLKVSTRILVNLERVRRTLAITGLVFAIVTVVLSKVIFFFTKAIRQRLISKLLAWL